MERAPIGKAGEALEREAGEDGGAAAAAGVDVRLAAQRCHRGGAAAVACSGRAGPGVATFLAAARGAGVATAAAGAAAAGAVRHVPVPRLLGGAERLAAAVRARGGAARPPRLLQSVPASGGGCRGAVGAAGRGFKGPSFSSGVTKDVVWEDSLTIGLEGPLLGWCVVRLLLRPGTGLPGAAAAGH